MSEFEISRGTVEREVFEAYDDLNSFDRRQRNVRIEVEHDDNSGGWGASVTFRGYDCAGEFSVPLCPKYADEMSEVPVDPGPRAEALAALVMDLMTCLREFADAAQEETK